MNAVTGTFVVVYSYWLLYHLEDPAAALSAMAARCLDLLLVETCVSFGGHADLNPVSELRSDPTQSFRSGLIIRHLKKPVVIAATI